VLRLACALLLALTLAPLGAHAQPAERVIVTVAASDAESAHLEEVLRELLGRLGVELTVERRPTIDASAALTPDPKAEPALSRAWVDMRVAGTRRVIVVDSGWERALVRVIVQGARSDEVVREEIAHVIHSASEALLAGAQVGEPREEVRRQLGLQKRAPSPAPVPPPAPPNRPLLPPFPPPEPPAEAPTPWRVGAGLYYEGQGYAERQPVVHGPGLALEVDAPEWTLGPGLELTAQYRIPFEVEGDVAAVRLQSAVLRLFARLSVFRSELIVLQVAAGAGVDVIHLEPRIIEGADARAEPARTRVAPLIRPALHARVRLFGDTALWIALSGDVDIIGVRYVIRRGSEDIPLVEPLRFRPALSLGISTSLAGGDLFLPSEMIGSAP
jgi:hypothetical protein